MCLWMGKRRVEGQTMEIRKMRVDHLKQPLGCQCQYPVFSWVVVGCRGKFQKKARVEIALDRKMEKVIYDSGWHKEIDSLGFCPNVQLSPRTRYYWKVRVRTERGETLVSPVDRFETGKMQELWAGDWIGADFNRENREIHPLFQKNFHVPQDVISARLYICGLGLFEAKVNGKRVSEEYLAPFYTDYANWIQCVTYDITDLLVPGEENALGVSLGNGWYKGRFSYEKDMTCLYGDRFQMIGEIRMETQEGKEYTVASDESWQCAPSPVLESSIYDGEVYDARLEQEDLGTVRASFSGRAVKVQGPGVPVRDRLSPPLIITQRIKPEKLIKTPAGETVLDFGQEITGWVRFLCREEEGKEIRLQHGEVLQKGNFYRENLRSAKAELRYISNGKKRYVRPHFTFFGFRYVKVEGIEKVYPEDFTACVLHSGLARTGRIETSSQKVDRLFENTIWSQRGNFLDVPTDCPQRDERMGWTGDAQAFCGAACYHMESPAFYRKYLYDMKLDQGQYEGGVPHVVPDVLGQVEKKKAQRYGEGAVQPGEWTTYGSCGWGDAACIIPWTLYCFYGDELLLAEQYPVMRDWVEYIRRIDLSRCGGSHIWKVGFHFADWLSLDNPDKESCFGGTDTGYVATAFYYHSVCLTAKAARVLSISEDERNYRKLAGEIKRAFCKTYFTRDGEPRVKTQTALALALYWRLAPKGSRDRLIGYLKEDLQAHGMHLTTGFVGTCYLCPALSESGLNREAYSLLLQETYPGWLYEVKMGATTIWERWDSILPDGMISGTEMNSLNHYAYGVIAQWMYQYMCGLRPVEKHPGFRRAIIAPMPDKRLKYVHMTYDSASGVYESGWEWRPEGICFFLRIPFDAAARFRLPFRGKTVRVNGRRHRKLERTGELVLSKGSYEILVSVK